MEEALDLLFDRLLMMMMMMNVIWHGCPLLMLEANRKRRDCYAIYRVYGLITSAI